MSELFFKDFRVPAGKVLGEEGKGFCLMMQGMERERMSMWAQCVGMAERALAIALEHARSGAAYGRTLWHCRSFDISWPPLQQSSVPPRHCFTTALPRKIVVKACAWKPR